MARIDELLSRNDIISKNLKEKLNRINESNDRIRNDIDSIKPYVYDGGDNC